LVVAGALEGEDPAAVNQMIEGLIREPGKQYAVSNHRLSRYIVEEGTYPQESLRSHVDWSLVTAIPLSHTPGLQLWQPQRKTWAEPEILDEHQSVAEHSRYVVIMAGRWLELITKQQGLSCIHRVTTLTTERLSAPFFLRPKESLFETMQQEFNTVEVSQTIGAAISSMSSFVFNFIPKERDAS
jgi:isopenicillin N synthase-like dioxygenase